MVSYYDFVLVFIPLVLLGIPGVLAGVGLDLTVAVPLGAGAAAALIGHAMFVRAPIDAPHRPTGSTAAGVRPAD